MSETVGERLAEQDARAFAGRAAELASLDALLGEGRAVVAYVHGPGGIGKSALLREVGRRGRHRGYAVQAVDGHDLTQSADALDDALEPIEPGARPLILLDTYERVAALGSHLRRHLLPRLPHGARIVVAGRQPPEPAWRAEGWDIGFVEVALGPLDDRDALALLTRRGMPDDEATAAIVRWAEGLPLALTVALTVAASGDDPPSGSVGPTTELDDRLAEALLRHVVAAEAADETVVPRDVLAVAGIARRVDARLIAAVLPGVDAGAAISWLRDLSFSAAAADRLALHDRVRDALHDQLRRNDPARERGLRRRIADHLHERAVLGEPWLLNELPFLIDDPAVRWGLGQEPDDLITDRVRAGDLDAVRRELAPDGAAWFDGIARWFGDAPEHIVIVRRGEQLAGFGIVATPAWLPGWAHEDAVLHGWIDHAVQRVHDGNVLFLRDAFDLTGDAPGAPSGVIAVGNAEVVAICGLPNPRWVYATIANDDIRNEEFITALGYQAAPALDVDDHGRRLTCFVYDHGPGGVIGATRDLVYRDLGLTPPAAASAAALANDVVRSALRSFHDPIALAASPLASGTSTTERAASVRRIVRDAVEAAFGDSDDERLQRHLVELAYLEPHGGHTTAGRQVHLARSTYFRRLAAATDRVARYVLDERVGPNRD